MARGKGKVLSLDFGNRNLHMVQGRDCGNHVEMDFCMQTPIPAGTIRDGVIINSSVLRDTLSNLLKSRPIGTDRATVCMKSTNIINREITVPIVKAEELDQLILFEMEQYVPNIGNDYMVKYVLQDSLQADGRDAYALRVSAVPRNMINAYSELIRGVNLKPTVMDTSANALSKLVARNRKQKENQTENFGMGKHPSAEDPWMWKSAAFIDLGYLSTEINVFAGDKMRFSRLLSYGSNQMDEELAGALQLDPAKLDELKPSSDLTSTELDGTIADMSEIMRANVTRWVNEIRNVLQFYTGRSTELQPEVYYIYGENADMGNLSTFMQSILNCPVMQIRNLPALQYKPAGRSGGFIIDLHGYLPSSAAIFRND